MKIEERTQSLLKMHFITKKNLNPEMHGQEEMGNTITVPNGVDPELLMKVFRNK